jgi:hypothetical protein
MQTHILFENFRVREGIFWADSNSGQCEIWFKQNPHCAHTHMSVAMTPAVSMVLHQEWRCLSTAGRLPQ